MKLNSLPTFNNLSSPFGLDISDLSIKLISLGKQGPFGISKKNKSLNLLSCNQIDVPKGYFEEGKIVKREKIIQLIKKLVKTAPNSKKIGNYVISVLPETKAFIKLIEIPACTDEQIHGKISAEIKNHFPFSPDEIYLDWQKIESPVTRDKLKILVSIAPKEIVEDYTDLLLKTGLKPLVLEIESSAIIRALLPEEVSSNQKSQNSYSSTAIIDIGATRTSLIFYDFGTIQFTTSVPFSGQKITEKISSSLKLNLAEAEKAKIKCGLKGDKCQGILKKILFEDLGEMVTKIKNSFVFYKNHFTENNPIQKIIICGGGANFKGISEILEQELKINIETANPLINLNNQKIKIPKDQILGYTTAIGLALRGILIND